MEKELGMPTSVGKGSEEEIKGAMTPKPAGLRRVMDESNRETLAELYGIDANLPDDEFARQLRERMGKPEVSGM